MANFGALTDHFALAATAGTLIEESKVPRPNSRVDAQDENGDIAASEWHGNKAGSLYDATCVYQVDTTAVDLSNLSLGQLDTGIVALSIEVATSNGDWPKITVTGVLGTGALEQDKVYALPAITVNPYKRAQAMGVTVTTGKLTSCSVSASCDLAEALDGDGEPVAHGVSGAVLSASAEAVATSAAAPVLAAAVGYDVVNPTGITAPQANWHTAAITVEKVLTVTITPPP